MDPIIFSALGGLLANALSGIVGSQADRAVVAAWRIIVERLRKGGRPVNRDLQRAVLRSFILALKSICDDCLKELKAEKNASAEDIRWLKEKRRSLEEELKKVEKLKYSEPPSEVFDEMQLLLLPDGTLAQERLQALKSALVRAAIGESEPPRCYKDKCDQSLFELMSAYFAEEIKHNQVVRNIFEGKLLAQIDVRLQEQELKLDTITRYLSALIAPPLPEEPIYRYRRQILAELYEVYMEHGPNNYVLADQLDSWKAARSSGNQKLFTTALSQLAAEEYILSVAYGNDRRAAVALNPQKLEEVQRIVLPR
jgi:hypothetical protein